MGRLILLLMMTGCNTLVSVEPLRCGNGLHEIEANEDCDGLPDGSAFQCGAAGTARACHYICDDAACPDGWTCGADAVCRYGTGRFEPPTTLPLPGSALDVADLDADGFDDILVHSLVALQVAFGEPGGAPDDVRTRRLDRSEIPGVVGDADGDGLADYAVATRNGVQLFRGRRDRQLLPDATYTAAPTGRVPFLAPVRAAPPYENQQALGIWQAPGAFEMRWGDQPVDTGAFDLFNSNRVPETIGIADIDAEPSADEIAFFVFEGQAVVIATVDCPVECALEVRETVMAPPGFSLLSTHFGDLNADGFQDLIVSATRERGLSVLASYGSADGFGPLEENPRWADLGRATRQGRDRLLAVVDLSGDARADFVLGQAIYRQTGEPSTLELIHTESPPFNVVFPVDLDEDERMDLVTARDASVGRIIFDDDRLTVQGTAIDASGGIAVGDFDADGTIDVAALAAASGGLRLLFGGADQLTETPISALLQPAPDAITSVRTRLPTSQAFEADTIIAAGADSRFELLGSRLGLPTTPQPFPGRVSDLAMGRFFDGETGMIATISGPPGRERIQRSGDLLPVAFDPLDDPCLGDPDGNWAITRVVDFDGDGTDELITLTSRVPQVQGVLAPRTDDSGRWLIHRVQVDGLEARCLWTGQVESPSPPTQLLMADVNADGIDDIVAVLNPTGRDIGTTPSQLAVWLGTPNSHAAVQTFDLPASLSSATRMGLSGRPAQLVIAGDGMAWRTRWVDDQLDFEPLDIPQTAAVALASGDINGDGADDLVVKTATSVSILRQTVCTARAVWEGTCVRPDP